MGIMELHQTFHSDTFSDQACCNTLQSDNYVSSSSLSSQPSLPLIPSLSLSLPQTHHHYCLTTFRAHSSSISSLTLAGKILYSGSSDKEIRSWARNPFQSPDPDSETPTRNPAVTAGHGAVKSLVVSSDKLFSAHQDHKIRVWKISRDYDHPQKYTRLATLPTLGDRTAKLLTPNNQVQIRRHKKCTWVHHVDTVSGLALSNDESQLYSVSWDRTLKIWRTSDFKCLESVNAHDDAINAVALSEDGHVYTGSTDKKIKVWRRNPGEKKHCLVQTLEKHSSGINALALSDDGSVLYSGACDRSVLVWERDEGSGEILGVVGALRGHTKAILCLAVVSDLVCSGSADKTIRIWRRGVGRDDYVCLMALEGHNGPVKCLAAAVDRCSQNDRSYTVYSGGLDCDIRAWQICVPLL